ARAHDTTGAPPSGYIPASGTPSGCSGGASSGGFTPNQYLTAYGFDPLHAAGASGGGERVALIEIDGFKESDIVAFARCFGLDVPPITVFEVGSRRQLPPGGESTLDLEVLSAAAPRLDHIQVYENNGNAADVDKSFVLPLIHPGAKPPIVSASLGLCEPEMVQAFGAAGIRSSESSMQLAAATGITVLASSGDEGSADCKDQNGNVIDHLAVNYPSSSPWVTGVGGTNLQLAATNAIQGEDIWNDTTAALAAGGGGLSAVFGRPSYQRDVVSQNARVVPDVAMLADEAPGYAIYCTAVPDCVSGPGGNPWQQIGGTSAATPLLAGGLALIDQDLRRHERETVGFANPLLYAVGVHEAQIQAQIGASVFNDVVTGSNDVGPYIPGGDGQPLGCCTAAPGFDAASGWGSVNLSALDQVALQALPAYGRVSLSIPRPQHPVAQRALRVHLTCSSACSTYAFAVLTLGRHHEFTVKSAHYRFARPTARTIPIRFSPGQERRLRAAVAAPLRVEAEAFAVALDTRGQVAKVTAGRAMRVIG
ncbi:MAG: S53 family peptidase, partial [Solirubrobacteraceae bacterium]